MKPHSPAGPTLAKLALSGLLFMALGALGGGASAWLFPQNTGLAGGSGVATVGVVATPNSPDRDTTGQPMATSGNTRMQPKPAPLSSSASVTLWELGKAEPTPATDKPLTAPNWRVVGTTQNGTATHALILFEGTQIPETRKVGEPMPGGAQLLGASGQHVELLYQGKRLFLFTGSP